MLYSLNGLNSFSADILDVHSIPVLTKRIRHLIVAEYYVPRSETFETSQM